MREAAPMCGGLVERYLTFINDEHFENTSFAVFCGCVTLRDHHFESVNK